MWGFELEIVLGELFSVLDRSGGDEVGVLVIGTLGKRGIVAVVDEFGYIKVDVPHATGFIEKSPVANFFLL